MTHVLRDMIYNTLTRAWGKSDPHAKLNMQADLVQKVLTAQADAIMADVKRICSNEDEYHQFVGWLNNMRLEATNEVVDKAYEE